MKGWKVLSQKKKKCWFSCCNGESKSHPKKAFVISNKRFRAGGWAGSTGSLLAW
jgi:hypothetical protein